jgi:hypothetical protein
LYGNKNANCWIVVSFSKKTFDCKTSYNRELRNTLRKPSKKGCSKFASKQKGTTFESALEN